MKYLQINSAFIVIRSDPNEMNDIETSPESDSDWIYDDLENNRFYAFGIRPYKREAAPESDSDWIYDDLENNRFYAFGIRPYKRNLDLNEPGIPAWFVNFMRNRGKTFAFHGHQIGRRR